METLKYSNEMNAMWVSCNPINLPEHYLTIISLPTSMLAKSPTISAISYHIKVCCRL